MAESTEYTMGHTRFKYLDNASISFAQGNYVQANREIDNFIGTVLEKTKAAMDLRIELDRINTEKKHQIEQLMAYVKTLGYLEAKDTENRGRDEIEINTIQDKKVACWRISMLEGLFND